MSSKQEHPIQAMGFWLFGFLSVVLAVLKLTVAGYWSWWRVMLPFLAFLGHNAVYLAGFLCFCRSEEHTSELQSRLHLVCRLLLEKKKNTASTITLTLSA